MRWFCRNRRRRRFRRFRHHQRYPGATDIADADAPGGIDAVVATDVVVDTDVASTSRPHAEIEAKTRFRAR
ncbi:MAG: hypothetical protein ACOYD7_01275 [Raoultibacter sp.]